jgi:acetolactate synthase-1/2/3 large subunit
MCLCGTSRRRLTPPMAMRGRRASPGVVLVTSGPGATNAVTGIATAYMDSIPMVVLSGQVQSHLIGEDAFQETDMLGISRPIVKHSFQVRHAAQLPGVIKKAFHIAASGRPGPVVIDIPKDITRARTSASSTCTRMMVKLRSYSPAVRGHSGQIRKAAKLLLSAKRPIIYSGGGVILGEGSDLLRELARHLGYPVTNTLMGLGAYPGSDRSFWACWACTVSTRPTWPCITRMSSSPWVRALTTA